MYRVISPHKLVEKRGDRTRKQIVDPFKGFLTEQDIYAFERGLHRPSEKKLPYLLKALNAKWEDISEPVELAV